MIVHTDGGSRGNPGNAAIGVIAHHQGKEVFRLSQYLGIATNNVAEYEAVLRALQNLIKEKSSSPTLFQEPVVFVLDSLLVVQQLTGKFAVKKPHIREYVQRIRSLISELGTPVQFTHVLRSENAEADALVNQALDEQPYILKQ
jgi:ribonuclease HI